MSDATMQNGDDPPKLTEAERKAAYYEKKKNTTYKPLPVRKKREEVLVVAGALKREFGRSKLPINCRLKRSDAIGIILMLLCEHYPDHSYGQLRDLLMKKKMKVYRLVGQHMNKKHQKKPPAD